MIGPAISEIQIFAENCSSGILSYKGMHFGVALIFFFLLEGFTGRAFNNAETSKPGPYSPVASVVLVSHTFIPSAVLSDEPVHFDQTNTDRAMN